MRIAGLLGEDYTAEIVRNKLDTLRGQYVRELHKETASKKCGAGADDVYKSRWKFFDKLDFLRGVVTPKKTISNLPQDDDEDVWFGKTVAAKMRKIQNEDVKVEVKYKIEKLLVQAVRQDTSGAFCPF
nr:hypothetical protein BaRGS_006046 [Batillaria attramentaria]